MSYVQLDALLQRRFDIAGAGLSALCAAHCLALPILLAAVPSLVASSELFEQVHPVLLFLILPISGLAIISGYGSHKKMLPFLVAGLGVGFLALGLIVGEAHWMELPATLMGSGLVFAAHATNYRFCKICPVCEEQSSCQPSS